MEMLLIIAIFLYLLVLGRILMKKVDLFIGRIEPEENRDRKDLKKTLSGDDAAGS